MYPHLWIKLWESSCSKVETFSSNKVKHLWQQALTPLRERLDADEFESWIKPLSPLSARSDILELAVPNRMFASWVEENYLEDLTRAWTEASGRTMRLKLDWAGSGTQEELFTAASPGQGELFTGESDPASNVRSPSTQAGPGPSGQEGGKRRRYTAETTSRLAPGAGGLVNRYDFDSFVVGPNNQFAHAAAMAVANQPGTLYNPFFVFGGVGLGKTHLVNAIGRSVLEASPSSRVLFLTADAFTNKLIDAIARNKAQEFKNRVRRVDCLILDDVQFLAGRERTQEEFFHIFNSLYQAGRQIVLTSDKFPNEIRGVEERLCNRFGWGLVADIQAPDTETRVAILERRARQEGIELPMDVAQLIASKVDSNIRDLEGALTRLSAYSSLNRCSITTELAEQLLGNLRPGAVDTPSLEDIEQRVTVHFGLKPGELKARRRTRKVAEARQLAMYMMRTRASASFPSIGQFLGGRDHSTVIHACRSVEKRIENDQRYRAMLETILRSLGCG